MTIIDTAFFSNKRFPAGARGFALLCIFCLLAACAGNDEQQTVVENLTEAYEEAKRAVERQNYRRGIQIFEAIQARIGS